MVRRSPLSPISLHRRRPRPATLDLSQSTFTTATSVKAQGDATQVIHITKNGPYIFHDGEEDEQARASAELAHAQALFTASLESDPIPYVRARSPGAYRSAGKSLPMEVEVTITQEVERRPSLEKAEEFRFPLPTGGYTFPQPAVDNYQFPAPLDTMPRLSIATAEAPERSKRCFPVPWLSVMRVLRAKGRRKRPTSRPLPEPLGFHERIAHADHEWRPANCSCTLDWVEDKGKPCRRGTAPTPSSGWPWR